MRIIVIILLLISTQVLRAEDNSRQSILLDKGWKFHRGDVVDGSLAQFDDSLWEQVRVPHDGAISGPFDMNHDCQTVMVREDGETYPNLRTGRTGALPIIGVVWYRKTVSLPNVDRDKRIFIEFDGAMSHSQIYLNGKKIGEWPYGYSSFSFELTDHFDFDGDNILAVRLENKPEATRWYSGIGLYRNVRVVVTNHVHVAYCGTYITTPLVTAKKATVNILTQIDNQSAHEQKVSVRTDIYDPQGEKVASVNSTQRIDKLGAVNQSINLASPQLWSTTSPMIYQAVTNLYVDNVLQESYNSDFGVRTIRYDKDHGFFLNDQPVKMKGVCLHHDLGPLGVAVNYRATERQLEIMKQMGVNAIRTSHNPPSPEQLELCDRMGILVMVEAFDEWAEAKNINGYASDFKEWAERDLRALIRRDRNHPSVVMWSIGNEVREQQSGNGAETAKFLTSICHDEDPTRPVTAGFNLHTDAIKNGLADQIDLVGLNYKPRDYKKVHEEHPNYVVYGSETASTVSSRGEYKFKMDEHWGPWYGDYHTCSYDLQFPFWGSTPDTEFEAQDECEFVFGEFVWTGFDYLGEPTPYNEGTPARSSYFGAVDLAGLPKDRFFLYQSRWSDTPMMHVVPHWTWPERVGLPVPVFCYTNYPKAELFVNGQSMGVKQKNAKDKYHRYRIRWDDVIYAPGEIKVVAYDSVGKVAMQQTVVTAGPANQIKLTADRRSISANGVDLSFITVDLLDKDGNIAPRADNMLFFEVNGAGSLKAVCNGDPTDQTSFVSNYMRVFNGKLVVIVESNEQAGDINLIVTGYDLKPASICINSL